MNLEDIRNSELLTHPAFLLAFGIWVLCMIALLRRYPLGVLAALLVVSTATGLWLSNRSFDPSTLLEQGVQRAEPESGDGLTGPILDAGTRARASRIKAGTVRRGKVPRGRTVAFRTAREAGSALVLDGKHFEASVHDKLGRILAVYRAAQYPVRITELDAFVVLRSEDADRSWYAVKALRGN